MQQLRDMMANLLTRIPDKDEINKRFAALNKKIKEIMEILAMLQGNHNDGDDAMFTKKPYGPGACASCEKNLINIIGMPVDFHAWKKLPFRDPQDRIARYG